MKETQIGRTADLDVPKARPKGVGHGWPESTSEAARGHVQ